MKPNQIQSKCICCGNSELIKYPAIIMPFVVKRIFDYDPVEINDDWGLRDIKNGHAYFVCNSLQCKSCGVLFLDRRFSDEELNLLYRDYRSDEYNQLREKFESGYVKIGQFYTTRSNYINLVEKFILSQIPQPESILDWGGDTGENTPLRRSTPLVHIYDISNKSTVEGTVAVDLDTLNKNHYDLIVCSQVLEHVSYPLEILNNIKQKMGADTYLYLEVPFEKLMQDQARDECYKELKKHWHEHVNFFSQTSILTMLKKLDLEVIKSEIIHINLGWRESSVISVICKKLNI